MIEDKFCIEKLVVINSFCCILDLDDYIFDIFFGFKYYYLNKFEVVKIIFIIEWYFFFLYKFNIIMLLYNNFNSNYKVGFFVFF